MRNCRYWSTEKCESVAVCDMKCIDLCNDAIKVTGIHFSYNKKKRNEKKILDSITKIQNVLKVGECAILHLKVKL